MLLTGTFEPFDPDRAEKAGCDAVVTKPFESQSLIHKVEELIQQAQSATAQIPAAPAPAPEAAASPWLDDTPAAAPAPTPAPASPFTTSAPPIPSAPHTHDNDIFGAAPSTAASADMPFENPADLPSDQVQDSPFGAPPAAEYSGETRAFPRMSFEEMQAMASGATAPQASQPVPVVPPPAAAEPSPWDEPAGSPFEAPAEFGGETRSFNQSDFAEMNQMAPPSAPAPAPEPENDAPFGAPPPAEEFSGETRAFPRMSLEELQGLATGKTPMPPAEAEPPAPAAAEASPWDEPAEPAAFSGETRAFPKMSFEDMQKMAAGGPAPATSEPAPWEEPAAPAWAPAGEAAETPFASTSAPEPVLEELPAAESQPSWSAPEPEPQQPAWPAPAPAPEPEPAWSAPEPVQESAPAAAGTLAPPTEPSIPIASRDLTDEQVDRIARRVVELMSEQVVRNIAWEVIPDLAESVVKERIRQLETEA